eukprot:Colp12_sorted_trinity150504_noHs@31960
MAILRYAVAVALLAVVAATSTERLRFNKDGTFKIVQFTDLHYGELPSSKDTLSAQVQDTILKAEKPDLVVMTGDMVSGYAWSHLTRNWFKSLWPKIVQPMIDNDVKWAFAFGNHDDQGDYTREQILELDAAYNLSLTQRGPDDVSGGTHYVLPIYSSKDESVKTNLYMFDSGDNNCEGVKGWGCVNPDQVEWYRKTVAAMKANSTKLPPALAFFHIPLPEFMNLWNNFETYGKLEDEGICCSSVNTGLFAAFKEAGDVVSVHVGHDHNNDFIGNYYGIQLAYGRKTGHGGYGPPAGWKRGARVLEITEQPFSIKTYIREEDGGLAAPQALHKPGDNLHSVCCGAVGAKESMCDVYERKYRATIIQ